MEIIIKRAEIIDAQTIADFQIAMARETENYLLDSKTILAGVTAVFEDSNKGCYYKACFGNIIVASLLTTYEWSDWRNGWVIWIQSVYVLPEYRKFGAFSKLYSFVKQQVDANENYKGIRLYVDLSNEKARIVYKKIGMNGEHYQLFEDMK